MRVRGKIGASEKTTDLTIAGGRVEEIHHADLSQACNLGGEDFRVSPGLIDIQINGYDGIDLNLYVHDDKSLQEALNRINALVGALVKFGDSLVDAYDNFKKGNDLAEKLKKETE